MLMIFMDSVDTSAFYIGSYTYVFSRNIFIRLNADNSSFRVPLYINRLTVPFMSSIKESTLVPPSLPCLYWASNGDWSLDRPFAKWERGVKNVRPKQATDCCTLVRPTLSRAAHSLHDFCCCCLYTLVIFQTTVKTLIYILCDKSHPLVTNFVT